MDSILQGMPHVICFLDDILITGATEAEHDKNLEEVLRRLQDNGFGLSERSAPFTNDQWST